MRTALLPEAGSQNSHHDTSPMEATASRFNGTLKKWNAERGFGFVVADHGDQELFVHVSAFPRDGRPPVIGEPLSFEMELDKEGRKRAVRVRRPGAPDPGTSRGRSAASRPTEHAETNSMGAFLVVILLIAGLAWYGYTQYAERKAALLAVPQNPTSPAELVVPAARPAGFRCDGRKYCSQMTSCREAKLFLQHCPGMEMDGDGDRIPCEEQWCSGSFGG